MLGFSTVNPVLIRRGGNRAVFALAAALVAALIAATAAAPARADATARVCGPGFDTPNGRFFAQPDDPSGLGFTVADESTAAFWTAYQTLGGPEAFGRPLSRPVTLHGFAVQAFERGLLQWDPAGARANVANTMDLLHDTGFDSWLLEVHGVPNHQTIAHKPGTAFSQVVERHLAILDGADSEIRAAFLATPDWQTRLGLPISYRDFGDSRVLRAQRAVLRRAVGGDVQFDRIGSFLIEAGVVPAEAATAFAPDPPADLTGLMAAQPGPALQGATVALSLAAGYAGLTFTWDDRPLPLVCSNGGWHTLVGLAAGAPPGDRTFQVAIGDAAATSTVTISAGEFPSATIQFPPDRENLLNPDVAAKELEFFHSVVSKVSGPPRWSGTFRAPADGPPTSGYGERRTLEPGSITSVHQGADIGAPLDTPVLAPNRATVAWAGALEIRGNTVILDHGFGVFTAFYHLNRIDVAAGDEVEPDQVVGAVGSTGRVTGVHLHWEVLVHGVAVDPAEWLGREFAAVTHWTHFLAAEAGTDPPQAVDSPTPTTSGGSNGDQTQTPAGGGNLMIETGVPPAEGPAG